MGRQLGRLAAWLARRLEGWPPGPLYAARCGCGYVGPPRRDAWAAEIDAVRHEIEAGS